MQRRWTMGVVVLAVAWLLGGCGGSEKPVENTTPVEGDDGEATGGGEGASDDQLDEIERTFDRKASIVARCFGEALNAGEIEKDAEVIVTVTTTITPAGKTSNTQIEKATTNSPAFKACVIRYVDSWDFPKVSEPTKFSHIYRIEEF